MTYLDNCMLIAALILSVISFGLAVFAILWLLTNDQTDKKDSEK